MAVCKNALKKFETEHADGIAATKAEFVKFLREGEFPQESMDIVALNIFLSIRCALKNKPASQPLPAAAFFGHIVEDGAYGLIEHLDNPENRSRDFCPNCDGEGYVYKAANESKTTSVTKKRAKSVAGVRGV
jgi:hypothetical protein